MGEEKAKRDKDRLETELASLSILPDEVHIIQIKGPLLTLSRSSEVYIGGANFFNAVTSYIWQPGSRFSSGALAAIPSP